MKLTLTLLTLAFVPYILASKSSKEATLRAALLDGYQLDAKPDGKVTVNMGLSVISAHLCGKFQVSIDKVQLRTVPNFLIKAIAPNY